MENIKLEDIISYSEMAGGIRKELGAVLEKPYLTSLADLKDGAGYLDIWKACLSEHVRATGDKKAEDILLKMERYSHVSAEEFETLDDIVTVLNIKK